jgi:cytoskeletal protein CcmA (bactofilin family)
MATITVNTSDTFEQWRVKTNSIGVTIEDYSNNISTKNVIATGNITASGNIIVTNVISGTSSIGNLTVSGNATLSGNVTSNLVVDGNVSVTRDVVLSSNATVSGNLIVTRETALSGNLVVTKDATVSGNINASGNVNVSKDAFVTGNTAISGNLSVAKDIALTGNTAISGNITIGKTATVTGNATVGGNIIVSKSVLITDNLGVGTNTPAYKVDIDSGSGGAVRIKDSSAAILYLNDSGASTTHGVYADATELSLRADSSYNDVVGVIGGSTHNIFLRTNGSNRMSINSSGAATFTGSVTADGGFIFPAVSAGSYYQGTIQQVSSLSSTLQKVLSVKVLFAGTVNVQFALANAGGGGASYPVKARIYVNGVAVGTERTSITESWAVYTEQITVSRGDNVQIYGQGSDVFFPHIQGIRLGVSSIPYVPLFNGILWYGNNPLSAWYPDSNFTE